MIAIHQQRHSIANFLPAHPSILGWPVDHGSNLEVINQHFGVVMLISSDGPCQDRNALDDAFNSGIPSTVREKSSRGGMREYEQLRWESMNSWGAQRRIIKPTPSIRPSKPSGSTYSPPLPLLPWWSWGRWSGWGGGGRRWFCKTQMNGFWAASNPRASCVISSSEGPTMLPKET